LSTPARAVRRKTTPSKPDLRLQVHEALEQLKAKDIREIDVRGKTGVTDWMVIASGTSTRHVKAIADEVIKQAKIIGNPPLGVEGEREAEWVLVDLGDVVVHVMLPRVRDTYLLERLWGDGDIEPVPSDAAEIAPPAPPVPPAPRRYSYSSMP